MSVFLLSDRYVILVYVVCQMSVQFVESMLDIHGRYSELVQSVFSADQQFYGALDKVTSSCRDMDILVVLMADVISHSNSAGLSHMVFIMCPSLGGGGAH